jgi:hypothetical protein
MQVRFLNLCVQYCEIRNVFATSLVVAGYFYDSVIWKREAQACHLPMAAIYSTPASYISCHVTVIVLLDTCEHCFL